MGDRQRCEGEVSESNKREMSRRKPRARQKKCIHELEAVEKQVARKTDAKEQCSNVKIEVTVDENLRIGNDSQGFKSEQRLVRQSWEGDSDMKRRAGCSIAKTWKRLQENKKSCTASVIHKHVFVMENLNLSSNGVSSLDTTEGEKKGKER